MSTATEKTGTETRSVLAPTGNRVRIFEERRRRNEMMKKPPEKVKKEAAQSPAKPAAAAADVAVERCYVSAESSSDSSSSASSSSGSIVKSAKTTSSRRMKNGDGVVRAAEIVPDGVGAPSLSSPAVPLPVKRCDWITPNSEPLYVSFHDEEWGVPVRDDAKLFELLVFSQALAELSWPLILSKRAVFRKVFNDFDPTSVANLDETRLLSTRVHGGPLLSEPKVRAVVDNAKQLLKIQQEFGSFSNYCWRFLNHKAIRSGFRYARQIPAKTPKSDVMSKDLMQRGFRCVGPTVVYSFMQVAGLVNDHLVTCYRYNHCSHENSTPS